MAGVGEEGFRHIDAVADLTEVGEVAGEPLVVVGVVVDLVGKEKPLLQVGVIDAGGGLLLPGGVMEALFLGVDVSGHVPHVGDAGGGAAEEGGGVEGLVVAAVIPEMDGVVVGGVVGIFSEDLVEDGI